MAQIKIGDVARAAGVSNSTVSRVLSGQQQHMRSETRERVLKIIEELGYRPNRVARGLVTGRTHTIGVVIPDVSNPFFGPAVRGCEDILYENGYSIFLCNTNEDVSRERYHIDHLISRSVDALIVWGTRIPCADLETTVGKEIPLLTVDLGIEPSISNHICINVDSLGGAMAATQHLIDQGYVRIAHLAGPAERVTSQRRLLGYQQSLEANGIAVDLSLVAAGAPSIRGGYFAALDLIKTQKPDALFCYNDLMALGAIVAAQQLNLDVPDDLGIVGFDDITMSALVTPPLTTIRIHQYELGKLTGELLLKYLHKHTPEQSILFPVELQTRSSSVKQPLDKQQKQQLLESLLSSISVVDLPVGLSSPNVAG